MNDLKFVKLDNDEVKVFVPETELESTFNLSEVEGYKKIVFVHHLTEDDINLGFGSSEEDIQKIVESCLVDANFYYGDLEEIEET